MVAWKGKMLVAARERVKVVQSADMMAARSDTLWDDMTVVPTAELTEY